MPPRAVLVRHGETEWTLSGRHTGRTDIPLTDRGRAEALAVDQALAAAGGRVTLVLSSPLQRALDTCRLAGLGDRAEITEDLREWDYGEYEGRTTTEIRAERPGWLLWRDGVPGGEQPVDVGRRADRVVTRVRAVADGDVALFAHGHILRVIAARWLGLAPSDGRLYALSPASISVLGWERELPVIELWNWRPEPADPPG